MEQLTYLKSILIGIFQGLTEFLPVSSSGHVMLLNEVFGLDLESEILGLFTVLLHAGTFLAVLLVYLRRFLRMLCHPVKGELKYLILGTVPTVAFVLLLKILGLKDAMDESGRVLLPYAFLFTGVLLILAEKVGKVKAMAGVTHTKVRARDALGMGLMQCAGTFAGVSRSGTTITGGLLTGLNRRQAADFSFMLSAPAILGALALDVMEMDISGITTAFEGQWVVVAAGIGAAFLFGLLAIGLMIRVVKKQNLKWFSVYLFLLGGVILINDFAVRIW